jgi:pSer/pThr/pTyr-binding forkhead associated (FHA) protein
MKTRKYEGDTAGMNSQPTEYIQNFPTAEGSNPTMILNSKKSSGLLAWLILVKGDPVRVGTTFRLSEDITSIGRDAENDIVLNDEAASNFHAKVRIEDNKFMLYDLVTTNGTFVNDKELRNSMELKENDKVRIGETVLVLKKI